MGQNNSAMVFVKIKNRKSPPAFTLVEILVTIGIMTIIFTIATFNLNTRKPKVMVENAAREFLSQLQFAKNLALTGVVFKDEDVDGQLDVPFGYGLHFFKEGGQDQYFIFGDLYDSDAGGNKIYDGLDEKTNWGDVVVDDKINVEITSDVPDVIYPFDIFFETLNGRVYYYYDSAEQDDADQIQAQFSYIDDLNIKQTVIINKNNSQIYLLEQ